MTFRQMGACVIAVVALIAAASAQQTTQTDRQYQAALHKEMVDRDLKGAIADYQKIAQGSDKALAAKALLRMAECHQKLGDSEAAKIYEQLVRDFGAQPEAVEAQTRLAAASGGSPTVAQVASSGPFKMRGPDTRIGIESIPSPDGTRALEVDLFNERIVVRDLASGRTQVAFALELDPDAKPGGMGVRWSRDGRRLWGPPIWSPDGHRIAFTVLLKTNDTAPVASANSELDVATLSPSQVRTVVPPAAKAILPLAWTTAGEILYSATPQPMGSSSSGVYNFVSEAGGDPRRVLPMLNPLSTQQPDAARFADLTPDGKSAVVIRSDHLALIDLATGDERALTLGIGVVLPRVSRDGRLVAFVSKQTGSWALYVAPLDQRPIRNPIRVASLDVGDPTRLDLHHTRWTTEGVLTCDYEANEDNIFRIEMDEKTGRSVSAPERLSHDIWAGSGGVSISPDSQHVAYRTSDNALAVMDRDGARVRRFAGDTTRLRLENRALGWRSPDEILFVQSDAKSIRLVNIETGAVAPVAYAIDPFVTGIRWQYMTAGNEIWYTLSPDRESVVARSLASGTERIALKLPGASRWLVSPDGEEIAYTVLPSGHPAEVRLIHSDGTGDKTLATMPWGSVVADPSPFVIAWAPDRMHLLYSEDSGGAPQVLDTKTGTSWPLVDPALGRSFLGREVGLQWNDGAWAPDGTFVTFILNTSQTRRHAFEGVTYDAVTKIMNERVRQ